MKRALLLLLWLVFFAPVLTLAQDKGGLKSEGIEQIRQAAEQGDLTAQVKMGMFHYSDEGISQDYTEAARWFRLAAQQG